MTENKQTILVIEDEPNLREGLKHNLELDGYSVETAATGTEGMSMALQNSFTLILLDLMLPEVPGLDILRKVRENGLHTPVIIISAKGMDHEKVAGLELGADDYVTKPFGVTELSARIRAVLRRTNGTDTSAPKVNLFQFPGLTVDFKRFSVTSEGNEHQLSRYEAEILRMLIDHRGEVVTRGDLLSQVWGYVHLPTTRTVDNHIARLRKKVEVCPDEPVHVVTVHGIGYRFESKEIS
ncbi:MAG: response regulator transcription factor [Planctomycetota bacterium]|nr:response regulator transcription factor [Planctomycetota bacterium]